MSAELQEELSHLTCHLNYYEKYRKKLCHLGLEEWLNMCFFLLLFSPEDTPVGRGLGEDKTNLNKIKIYLRIPYSISNVI